MSSSVMKWGLVCLISVGAGAAGAGLLRPQAEAPAPPVETPDVAANVAADRTPSFADVEELIAVLRPIGTNTASGIVRFSPTAEGIEIHARIEGLPSGTRHGFHVHVYGDCSSEDGSSAGPHYDPTHNMAGMMHHGMKPLGDLEDLMADEGGRVEVRFNAQRLTLADAENAILGRGLLLHESFADPNDPMASSGKPISCGTIGVFNAQSGL
jgi:superoxide dismutase, Cu-Zn family